MKKIISIVLMLLISFSPVTGKADSQLGTVYEIPADGVVIKGGSGGSQRYYNDGKNIVYYYDNNIFVDDGDITELATGNSFFVVGSKIISYGYFEAEKKYSWYSYDLQAKKIKYSVLPIDTSVIWSDDKGVYYEKFDSKNLMYLNLQTGKSKTICKMPGQIRGILNDGSAVFINFAQRQIISVKNKKQTILYKGNVNLRDATVVGDKVYVSRTEGLYRIDGKNRLTQLYGRYSPIVAQSGNCFVTAMTNNENNDLMGDIILYINYNDKHAKLGECSTANLEAHATSATFSHDGTGIILTSYATADDFRFDIPPYYEWDTFN